MRRNDARRATQRGVILTLVLGVALICSIMAYGVLYTSVSDARRNRFVWERNPARYAAEAGLVWGMTRLWTNPGWTGASIPIGAGKMMVTLTVEPCSGSPCPPRPFSARVSN